MWATWGSWATAALAALGASAGCAAGSDGAADPACGLLAWQDVDGDGAGDPDTLREVCALGPGEVDRPTDCDDADPAVHPGASERCNGIDDDCDGLPDDGLPHRTEAWYPDADGDGYGAVAGEVLACAQPPGYVADFLDCDDRDAAVHPGAAELCNRVDDDCDLAMDDADDDVQRDGQSAFYNDGDGDGWGNVDQREIACDPPYGAVDQAGDCDDADNGVHPGAREVCNVLYTYEGDPVPDEHDDDCDGDAGDDDPDTDPATKSRFYDDRDRDGLGGAEVLACEAPRGTVVVGGDCDDTDASVLGAVTWAEDRDGDGYTGATASETPSCAAPAAGWVPSTAEPDCDDGDDATAPHAYDPCLDGVDQDCDGWDDPCEPDCGFDAAAYDADLVFTDHQGAITMGLAWDGASLWSISGGMFGGRELSQYTAAGVHLRNVRTTDDFRSAFTRGDGVAPLLVRLYADPGVYASSGASFVRDTLLTGATLDPDGSVAWDEHHEWYVGASEVPGVLVVFDRSGALVEQRVLVGYGGAEADPPSASRLAVARGCVLTYHGGVLSAWDRFGQRVGTTTLTGAGGTFDAHASLSYAAGRVFVVDAAGGSWRGFDVGFGDAVRTRPDDPGGTNR